MTPVTIGSAIGAAALTVGRGAMGAVGNSLSFAAELVRATSGNAAPSEDSKSRVQAARAELGQRRDELRERIQRQLAAAGISLSEPVELVSSGQGGIAVAGPHPQQTAIEEALGSDVLLEHDFNRLASDYSDVVLENGAGELPPTLAIAIPKSA